MVNCDQEKMASRGALDGIVVDVWKKLLVSAAEDEEDYLMLHEQEYSVSVEARPGHQDQMAAKRNWPVEETCKEARAARGCAGWHFIAGSLRCTHLEGK